MTTCETCHHDVEAHLRERVDGLLGTCAVCEREGRPWRCQEVRG